MVLIYLKPAAMIHNGSLARALRLLTKFKMNFFSQMYKYINKQMCNNCNNTFVNNNWRNLLCIVESKCVNHKKLLKIGKSNLQIHFGWLCVWIWKILYYQHYQKLWCACFCSNKFIFVSIQLFCSPRSICNHWFNIWNDDDTALWHIKV